MTSIWFWRITGPNVRGLLMFRLPMLDSIRAICILLFAGLIPFAISSSASATEGGRGVYLLGRIGALAGYLPDPGLYARNITYHYNGETTEELVAGGRIIDEITGNVTLNIFNLTWVTNAEILGGRLAFATFIPFGYENVRNAIEVDFPNLPIPPFEIERDGSVAGLGDIVVGGELGWSAGNYHWSVYGSVFLPVGDYELGRVANLGSNHWAFDTGLRATYLNRDSGTELSVAGGFTFSLENQDTNYQNSTAFHIEAIGRQYLNQTFFLGASGYYYEQITDDTGFGATLGGFRGRVAGLGPLGGLTFPITEDRMMTAEVRYIHEFAARNRLEGDAVMLSLSLPL